MLNDPKPAQKLHSLVKGYSQVARNSLRILPHGWREYAAVGASMGLVSSAEAQIVSFVPDSPIQLTVPVTTAGFSSSGFEIDVDGDGVDDIQIGAAIVNSTSSTPGGGVTSFVQRQLRVNALGLAGFVADSVSAFGFSVSTSSAIPAQVASGELIDANNFFGSNSSAAAFVTSSSAGSPDGFVTSPQEFLFGFVIDGGDGDQFGWIRVGIEGGEDDRLETVEILEFAFQTVPGVGIEAGDSGVVAPPPVDGDFDGDGDIDADDFQEFVAEFNGDGLISPSPELNGNGNDDDLVNAADFTVFRDNLPASSPAVAAAVVPEPTSFSLSALALGAAGVASLRRRRSQS